MNIKKLFIGIAAGVTTFYFAKTLLFDQQNQSSEDILQKVKKQLKHDGKIIGSWIMVKPENFEKNTLSYKVYRGGITKVVEDKPIHYEFSADASTGTIIELNKLG